MRRERDEKVRAESGWVRINRDNYGVDGPNLGETGTHWNPLEPN